MLQASCMGDYADLRNLLALRSVDGIAVEEAGKPLRKSTGHDHRVGPS